MKDIVILGASGFAKEMLWLLEKNNEIVPEWNVVGFVDETKTGLEPVENYGVVGDDEWLLNYPHPINAICGIGSPSLRRKVIQKYKNKAHHVLFPPIVSRRADVCQHARLGEGSIVCTGVMIAPHVKLGDFVTINLGVTIGHDTVIQEFGQVNLGANISGNVFIESDCDIGIGTCIIQGKHIGPKTIIGAGSVIIRDIPGHCTVVGNPGRILEK